MHYTKKMKRELIAKDEIIRAASLGLKELEVHLTLPKFRKDTTVQVQDIQNWIMKIKQAMVDAEFDKSNHLRLAMIEEAKADKAEAKKERAKLLADPFREHGEVWEMENRIFDLDREIVRLENLQTA